MKKWYDEEYELYVGAIDLKNEPVEGVLTVENWQELKEYLKECL